MIVILKKKFVKERLCNVSLNLAILFPSVSIHVHSLYVQRALNALSTKKLPKPNVSELGHYL